jgi:hypothetical protein
MIWEHGSNLRHYREAVVGQKSLQDTNMHLVGQLSNPFGPLATVLEAAGGALRRPAGLQRPIAVERASRRLGNGVVQRAVVKVLASAAQPMRLSDIHSAVEELLSQVVSKESVSWCLRMSRSGAGPRFERVAYGSYRLNSQT